MTRSQAVQKRTFDLVAALLGLLLLWPLILACVFIARRETGLSGLYSQVRIGRHGRPFPIRKIRSMRAGSGEADDCITVQADPRITRSGAWMRRWKLDELPQLWNVLIGEMSLVGPRPDVPGYADRLVGQERAILTLRPGITGPATIKYRDEERLLAAQSDPVAYNDRVLYPDKVRLNLQYMQHWSLPGDLRYILVTVGLAPPPALLMNRTEASGKCS